MIGIELDNSVILKQQEVLEAALSTNPRTQSALQKLIRQAVMEARERVVGSIKFKHGDPRGAAQAVRTSVYRKILGANLNIYSSRKAHGQNSYDPPRKGVTGRGGNRRPCSTRTRQIMGYSSLDRGFILRWLNAGTADRAIKFTSRTGRKSDQWNKNPNTGNRGSIQATNFFRGAGEQTMAQAVTNLAALIDRELNDMLNK